MTNKKEKLLYVDFSISFKCGFNCDYCTLTKEQRQETDYLKLTQFKLNLFQIVTFYKKYNYDKLIIAFAGDELHSIPDFIDYMKELFNYIEKTVVGIPKEQIKVRMFSNLTSTREFYLEQFTILKDAQRFCNPEFETSYQGMYHTSKTENILNEIIDISKQIGITHVSSMVADKHLETEKLSHLPIDFVYDLSVPPIREKFTDKEVNFIKVVKSTYGIYNGCSHEQLNNLFKMEDKNFCSECKNESCVMMEDLNRI